MVKWKMINTTNFIGTYKDFTIKVDKSGLGWVWRIFKDDKIIDHCFNYAPTKSELDCRIQAERILHTKWLALAYIKVDYRMREIS